MIRFDSGNTRYVLQSAAGTYLAVRAATRQEQIPSSYKSPAQRKESIFKSNTQDRRVAQQSHPYLGRLVDTRA
jgi:hypothetical protein